VTGASCFNDAIRDQLGEAQDEVQRLIQVNCVLLEDKDTLHNIVDSTDKVSRIMYENSFFFKKELRFLIKGLTKELGYTK
jgi:hypothetical protein